MKTTVEIHDALLTRAKAHARRVGRPVRELIEEGLRVVLERDAHAKRFTLPDRAVGEPSAENPLENMSWSELRDAIYGGR